MGKTADICFGDAWVEPYSQDGNGTNVIVVRSPAIDALLQRGIEEHRLALISVDAELVVQTQAAGFRQRREGLAYRLTWSHPPVRKRVRPNADIPHHRKWIYRLRCNISKWSHPLARIASRLKSPKIYLRWARLASTVYHAFAYRRGKLGKVVKLLGG